MEPKKRTTELGNGMGNGSLALSGRSLGESPFWAAGRAGLGLAEPVCWDDDDDDLLDDDEDEDEEDEFFSDDDDEDDFDDDEDDEDEDEEEEDE